MPKKRGTPRFLILDACVLIDYVDADASVLGTVSKHVAPVFVARPVFDEVDQISEHEATNLGLCIVDVEYELASRAVVRRGALSFQDHVCLLLARERGWTCVTNDGALRRACQDDGVDVRWGLEIMVDAVRLDAMTIAEAEAVANAIHRSNPRFVTRPLINRFSKKLREA